MDTTVSIANSRETELQFDVSVEGTDVSEMQVRFIISADSIDYAFNCRQGDEAMKWVVKIPPLAHLKTGSYNFRIEIITNGYFFAPYKGKVNVTPEPVVSQSGDAARPSAPTVKISQPEPAIAEEKDASWTAPVMSEEKDKPEVDDLLDAFMKSRKDKPPLTEKEKKIKAALKDFNAKPLEIIPDTVIKEEVKFKPKKRKVAPKKRVVERKEPRHSNLDSVIKNMDTPKDDQTKKVLDIINSVDKGKE